MYGRQKMKEKKPLSPEEELLKHYSLKLRREAILKSCILAMICGFLLCAAVSVLSFLWNVNILWVSAVVFAAASVGLSFLFYFVLFRGNLRRTAARVDGIGLEERVITMVEFAGQDGLLVQKQRQDAGEALKTVSPKQMKTGVPKLFIILLILAALLGMAMASYSTVLAVQAETEQSETPSDGEEDEDAIIRELIEELRKTIDEAPVDGTLKSFLHHLVDDLEASLKPTDSLEVKKAKISETAQEIHKLIEEYLSRTTIGQELQKHDTTKPLGDAIVSGDLENVKNAFQSMYDSIAPHVMAGEYDILAQTADDIDTSIADASIRDEALQEALEKLAEALRNAIPKEPPREGEEEKVGGDVMQAVQDAFEQAAEDMKDSLEGEKEEADRHQSADDLDDALQDAIQDALDRLDGKTPQDPEAPEEPEDPEEDPEGGSKPDEEEGGGDPPPPPAEGDVQYDSVIDGKTPYDDVYGEYYEKIKELLESGELTDEERQMIEDYFKLLG